MGRCSLQIALLQGQLDSEALMLHGNVMHARLFTACATRHGAVQVDDAMNATYTLVVWSDCCSVGVCYVVTVVHQGVPNWRSDLNVIRSRKNLRSQHLRSNRDLEAVPVR